MGRTWWGAVVHLLQHAGVVIAGLAMIVIGLGLTFSLVMVLPGIILLAVGAGVVVAGLFTHVAARL